MAEDMYLSDLQTLNEATGDTAEVFIKVHCRYDCFRITILNALTLKTLKGEVTYEEMQQTAAIFGMSLHRFKTECLEVMTHRHKDASEFLCILGEKHFKIRKKEDSDAMYLEVQLHEAPESWELLETACDLNNALDERIEANESAPGNSCSDPKQSREYKVLLEEYKTLQSYLERRKAAFMKSAAFELNARKKRIAKLKKKLRALEEKNSEDPFDGETEKI